MSIVRWGNTTSDISKLWHESFEMKSIQMSTATATERAISAARSARHDFRTTRVKIGIPWRNHEKSCPVADFRSIANGASDLAIMNFPTYIKFLNNKNMADLYGIRHQLDVTINDLASYNAWAQKNGLPKIVIDDEVLLDEDGKAHRFIPNDLVFIVPRSGATVCLCVG